MNQTKDAQVIEIMRAKMREHPIPKIFEDGTPQEYLYYEYGDRVPCFCARGGFRHSGCDGTMPQSNVWYSSEYQDPDNFKVEFFDEPRMGQPPNRVIVVRNGSIVHNE
jgi:hypothetical protein